LREQLDIATTHKCLFGIFSPYDAKTKWSFVSGLLKDGKNIVTKLQLAHHFWQRSAGLVQIP
jgi:hypothetical protein